MTDSNAPLGQNELCSLIDSFGQESGSSEPTVELGAAEQEACARVGRQNLNA